MRKDSDRKAFSKLGLYTLLLLYTLLMCGLFFLWLWVSLGARFQTLMADYGSTLLTFCVVIVAVFPLVGTVTRSWTSAPEVSEERQNVPATLAKAS
ncbi:hypothetical protein SAMN05421878_10545 [Actinobaculum suis]|uniref:Uncharacterized protein n=1 Tax=Actinobaculum suis TaxID=1657 RepID=A0A1G7BKL2_9ACTO|nr:hypothetical protein [Actinobaculum suis]SDE27628.1 hypothetical protein SAMN05421878_10545 [Actinobaculum suis]